MGYALCMSTCYSCRKVITYNPTKVPSVKDKQGKKQPLCASCVGLIQAKQREQGNLVWPPPLPGAYEACNEEELL